MQTRASEALERPVQFFTGKGGVGKSTIIAAVAMRAARAGHRPLVVDLGAHTSSAHLLGRPTIAYEPAEIVDGVHATRVLFEPALVDYVSSRLKLRPLAKLVARNDSLRRLFMAAPGVDEIVTMHRVAELSEGGDWGPVLVDLESTGNALMFFDLPQVLDAFLEDGPLRQVVDSATRLLHDPDKSVVHIVTVPEPLVVRETIDLYRGLLAHDGLHVGRLFVNRVPRAWLDGEARARVQAHLEGLSPEEVATPEFAWVDYLLRRRVTAEKCIRGLRRDIRVPTSFHEVSHAPSPLLIGEICGQLEGEVTR